MSKKTIYHGGTIFTMDGSLPRAEAVFVEDGVIKAVGAHTDMQNLVDADTRKIDLNGGFLVPGLIESHNHLSYFAIFLEHCYLGGGACESIDDAVQLLKDQAAKSEDSEFISGYGFDDTYTPALRHLNKSDLDRVSSDKPVLVYHMSGHVGYVNSRALEFFGISKSTENPEGGWIPVFTRMPDLVGFARRHGTASSHFAQLPARAGRRLATQPAARNHGRSHVCGRRPRVGGGSTLRSD